MANVTWSTTDKVAVTLTGSNLIATSTATTAWVHSSDRQVTGKFYFEIGMTTWVNASTGPGISTAAAVTPNAAIVKAGTIFSAGTSTGLTLGARASGDIIGIALDLDAPLIWFRVSPAGNWNGSGTNNPATGVGGVSVTGVGGAGIPLYAMVSFAAVSDAATGNFGDTAFSGALPAGFTSGFTAGATINTNALATQIALEHWATVTSTGSQALTTQVAVEHWASVRNASLGSPMVTMIG